MVSGFLITRLIARQPEGLLKPDLRSFYSRRIGRIVPLLALVCLIGAWLISHAPSQTPQYEACLKSSEAVIGPAHWLTIATFTCNWYVTFFSTRGYKGLQWDILWSLSIEEQFYFFYPFILRLSKKLKELVGFLVFLILLGLLVRGINCSIWKAVLSYNSFQNFDAIALGCLLYLTFKFFETGLRKNKWVCGVLCLCGLVLAGLVYIRVSPWHHFYFYWFGRFGLSLGVAFFLLGAMARDWFESRYWSWLALPGHLSYGMYLLHPLVLYFLWNFLKGQNLWVGFFILTVVTTLVGYVSFRFFEMPVNLWIRKRLNP